VQSDKASPGQLQEHSQDHNVSYMPDGPRTLVQIFSEVPGEYSEEPLRTLGRRSQPPTQRTREGEDGDGIGIDEGPREGAREGSGGDLGRRQSNAYEVTDVCGLLNL